MKDNFQAALQALKNLETPQSLTAKTAKTPGEHKTGNENLQTQERPTAKTAKITNGYKDEAAQLGLIAAWSREFGYVSLHDPTSGEWYDLPVKVAPSWALWEAHKRKELYKDGNRRAYRLTSREMKKLWADEQPSDEGILEEYTPEGEHL
jgi:hypothetical protein